MNDVLYKADLTGDEIASHEEQRAFKQNLLPDDWSNSQKLKCEPRKHSFLGHWLNANAFS